MERIKERTGQYEVSVRITSNGYYEARVSFKLGGGRSPRLSKSGKSKEQAVLNLLVALDSYIDTCYKSGIITTKIDDCIPQRLMKSINDLEVITSEITAKTLAIVNKINSINSNILNTIPTNIIPFYNPQSVIPNAVAPVPALVPNNITNNLIVETPKEKQEICIIEDIVNEWHLYRLSLCKKTEDNPQPLSQNTIDSDYDRFDIDILPYFKKNKILYLTQVTDETVKSLIKNIKSQHSKNKSYIVLNMLFEYAIENNKINFNPVRKVEKPPEKIDTGEEEIDDNYIEPENQDIYLDRFEETNTDMSILFETMLLTGIRPEEACRFEVESIRP